jgi:hypothetical protein
MDGQVSTDLQQQIDALKRALSRVRVIGAAALGAGVIAGFLSVSTTAQDAKALRLRSLVIEDDAGNDCIVLGSPVPDPREGHRISPSSGLVINDERGVERFGVGLQANGSMTMGFDAPPGTGDDRNRERISIVADGAGGSSMFFHNRKTQVPGRLELGADDQFYLEFLDFQDGKVTTKRIGFKGEEIR